MTSAIRRFADEIKPSTITPTTTTTPKDAAEASVGISILSEYKRIEMLKPPNDSAADISTESIQLKNFFPGLRNESPPAPIVPPGGGESSASSNKSTDKIDWTLNRPGSEAATKKPTEIEWIMDPQKKQSSTADNMDAISNKEPMVPSTTSFDEKEMDKNRPATVDSAADTFGQFLDRMPVILHQAGDQVSGSLNRVISSFPPYKTIASTDASTETQIRKRLDDALQRRKAAQKHLEHVPGPVLLKTIARIWNVVPIIGGQLSLALYRSLLNAEQWLEWHRKAVAFRPSEILYRRYGSIVHLAGPFGGNIVMLYKPAHMAVVLNSNENDDSPVSIIDCIAQARSLETIRLVCICT